MITDLGVYLSGHIGVLSTINVQSEAHHEDVGPVCSILVSRTCMTKRFHDIGSDSFMGREETRWHVKSLLTNACFDALDS